MRSCRIGCVSSILVLLLFYGAAHAEEFVIHVDADRDFPMDMARELFDAKIETHKARPLPWYEEKQSEKHRIFEAAGIKRATKNWDAFEENLFLDRLDYLGAKGVASKYPQFSEQQLMAAEKEMREVKGE